MARLLACEQKDKNWDLFIKIGVARGWQFSWLEACLVSRKESTPTQFGTNVKRRKQLFFEYDLSNCIP